MYGMVNNAVRELVLAHFGEESWQRIKAAARVEFDSFMSTEGYDDRITYDLVAAASSVLGLPPESILEAFGEWWVLHTAPSKYGDMMDVAGSSLGEFLENLPNFHARVSLLFPRLQPPEFALSERTARSCILHYYSHREGLQPMVIGLVKGLAKRFDTPAVVKLTNGRHNGLDHDEFLIEWDEPRR